MAAEARDGIRRVFHLSADQVIAEVPAYGRHLQQVIDRLGRNHPMVRTQYYCEEIDAEGGLFTPERQALMQGVHPPEALPQPGETYVMLLDVAGAIEAAQDLMGSGLSNPGRDATALTIVAVEPGSSDGMIKDCRPIEWFTGGCGWGCRTLLCSVKFGRWRKPGGYPAWWWMPPGWARD